MKMLKQFFLVPALAFWILCVGMVILGSCGSNRGSATQQGYSGNSLDEPVAAEGSEEGAHHGEGHEAEQPGEAVHEKTEHAGEAMEAKADSTEAKPDTAKVK